MTAIELATASAVDWIPEKNAVTGSAWAIEASTKNNSAGVAARIFSL